MQTMESNYLLPCGISRGADLSLLSPEAQLALTTIRNLPRCESPLKNIFQIRSDNEFQALKHHLREDMTLWHYLEDNARIDYSGRSQQLKIRTLTQQGESFCSLLANEIKDRLRGIATTESQAIFIASIYDDGNTTCSYNGANGLYRWEHSPDIQYRYKSNVWPAVIIETAYSQPENQLEDLALDYISGSDGRVKLVIGINIDYKSKLAQGSFSLWRPKWKVNEKGMKMLSLTHSQEEFCVSGKPIGDGIPLNLSEFSLNSPKVANIIFNLSSESLTRFILDAQNGNIRRGSLYPSRKFSVSEPILVLERTSSSDDDE